MARWGEALMLWARRTEAPTWMLTVTIYGGWLALTFFWHRLPAAVVVPVGAWLCAWHMSLQHELIHGHPTRSGWANDCLATPPLNLWLPYALYRDEHRRHHRDVHLTDPLEDPESTYMSAEAWGEARKATRSFHGIYNTIIGRMLLGPPRAASLFWLRQMRSWRTGASWRAWLGHAVGICLVLGWVCGLCRIGLGAYVLCVVYPGTALIMVRSLAEHRAAERPEDRTAVVEHAGLLGLLFLNNNLHALHHEQPGLPWYALPAHWRLARARLLGERRGPVYHGYLDVAQRYAVNPHHSGPHPFAGPRIRQPEPMNAADSPVLFPNPLGAQVAV